MGSILKEFEKELEHLQKKYATKPREQLIYLCLLALEREQIVSVAYREDLILERLSTISLDPKVKDLIHYALLWGWKDEEMHAVYLRGLLLKFGRFSLKIQTFITQIAGCVGGWSSSVQQHIRFLDAPISRTISMGITWAGFFSGKVPRQVLKHLQYCSFREFCEFNIDTEKTAWLCWKYMAELVEQDSDLPKKMADDFRHIEEDEDNHYRLFEILTKALDKEDRLLPGESFESLIQKIGEISEYFLPPAYRTNSKNNSIGTGGEVQVVEGTSAAEKVTCFRQLLKASGLKSQLEARAQELGKSISDFQVVIKVNFMLGYHRKDLSNITDPVLIKELAYFLKEVGCETILVVEGRNLYDNFFQHRSVKEVARYFGIESSDFQIRDLTDEQVEHPYFRGMGQYTVGESWKTADFRISFAKMCSHAVEQVYLNIGNMDNIGQKTEESIFIERQIQRETATMMLLNDFPTHFCFLDAYERVADGLLGMMGCPKPKFIKRFYAGIDPLSVDLVASKHMGLKDLSRSPILKAAIHWFGNPSGKIQVSGVNQRIPGWHHPYYNEFSTILSFLSYPVYQFGSGRGALFVPEMDEDAFPPMEEKTKLLDAGRRSLQAFLGLRHGRKSLKKSWKSVDCEL